MKSLILVTILLLLAYASSLTCRGPYTAFNNKCIWLDRLDPPRHKKNFGEAKTVCMLTFPMGTLARRSLIDNEKDMRYISAFGMGQRVWIRDDTTGAGTGNCTYTDGKKFGVSPCNTTYGFVCID
ncbi:C-type lectin family protein [Flamingopox virus FGPVKD09]|uniref:C-type lectin family protein n=1 Tax=Flamingopox virus FGPVKD09 TaxID=2059380 RepID=A0A2H4X2R8_9POXV|nr:C-type lectin family protein [Flamingopox virus FGPVKD09]AUD40359.1 C-type lectin family protein [Flamingopox virus FGPVKD09]